MSFTGVVEAALQIGFESIVISPVRGLYNIVLPDGSTMADILAQATIEERHFDQLEITEHPVEQGAAIADHAFKRPAEITLKLGWSNSPSQSGSLVDQAIGVATAESSTFRTIANAVEVIGALPDIQSVLSGSGQDQINAIYANLLFLQSSRALFDVYTGKRVYTNMVCKTLTAETDVKTANALVVTLVCQQVILVSTQTVSLPKSTQANPAATASPVNKGQVSAAVVGG